MRATARRGIVRAKGYVYCRNADHCGRVVKDRDWLAPVLACRYCGACRPGPDCGCAQCQPAHPVKCVNAPDGAAF